MAKTNLKIIDFGDYLRSHQLLDQEAVETIIGEQRGTLRQLDAKVIDLLPVKHKLKDIQRCKDSATELERNLLQISDWLEDKITSPQNEDAKVKWQTLFKQCEQLISRNDRIKKNITDDMASCRYVEGKLDIDPVKVGSFLIGAPLTLAGLTKTLITDNPDMLWRAGKAGFAVGVFLSFHRQAADLCARTGHALANGTRVNALRKNIRHSVFIAAMAVSTIRVKTNGIQMDRPKRIEAKPKICIAAKL